MKAPVSGGMYLASGGLFYLRIKPPRALPLSPRAPPNPPKALPELANRSPEFGNGGPELANPSQEVARKTDPHPEDADAQLNPSGLSSQKAGALLV
jgi:hypothetical protein